MPESPPKADFKTTAAQLKNRSIYLLPNLFTTAALFSGFYAVIHGIGENFRSAALAIFIAMIFDGLDGRVARLTQTQSPFGAEYDSLSDMVSFGVAPSLLVYEWALRDAGKLGWAAAFIFCAAAALRLARFNTNVTVVDKRYFQGLPSPAAAAIIASTVWTLENYGIRPTSGSFLLTVIWIMTIAVGLLMVSNVLYHSGKAINFRRSVSMGTIMILAIIIVSIAVFARNLAEILLISFGLYAASGLAIGVWRFVRNKTRAAARRRASSESDETEPSKTSSDKDS